MRSGSGSLNYFPWLLGHRERYDLPYAYISLDLIANEIRVIVLQSSEYTDPLKVTLSHMPLDGKEFYGALSYPWGDPTPSHSMKVRGHPFAISENLDAALRDIRTQKAKIVLWIDAICINQNDISERSRQIVRMQEIYDAADTVCIWLGTNDKTANIALDFAAEMKLHDHTVFTDETEIGIFLRTEDLARVWAALYTLFQRPFFCRRWVIQEIASATPLFIVRRDHKFLFFGWVADAAAGFMRYLPNIVSLWTEFDVKPEQAFNELEALLGDRSGGFLRDMGVEQVNSVVSKAAVLSYFRYVRMSGQELEFLQLAVIAWGSLCIDHWDIIFALSDLSSDCTNLDMRLDYSKTTKEIYMEFLQAYTIYHKSLDIMCASQVPIAGQSYPRLLGPVTIELPSWCPDWSQKLSLNTFVRRFAVPLYPHPRIPGLPVNVPYFSNLNRSLYVASGRLEAKPLSFCFEGSVLQASGIIVDRIIAVSNISHSYLPLKNVPIQ